MRPRLLVICLVILASLIATACLHMQQLDGRAVGAWTAAIATQSGRLRIATFNIRYGRGASGEVDLQPVADFAAAHTVDTLFLNEVDYNWSRSGRQDQTQLLAELTGMRGSFYAPALRVASVRGSNGPAYGNALLSHVPWESAKSIPLPRTHNNEPRNIVVARFPLGTSESHLTIIGTHLSTNRAERLTQVEFIVDTFPVTNGPMLLVGDLNSGPHEQDIRALLDAGWIDVWNELGEGEGATFPATNPRYRIDYVFASPEAAAAIVGIELVPTEISDHLPLIVDVDLSKIS